MIFFKIYIVVGENKYGTFWKTREDTLVSVGCLKTNPTLCSSTLIGVSIIV